jgi:acyl carrier protein
VTEDEIRALIGDVLTGIAPEADLTTLAGDADLREELDLDSMDFLNLMIGLHDRGGFDIPEVDYPHFATLDGAVAYLKRSIPLNRPGFAGS